MKINYRFTFAWERSRGALLESLGLTVEAPLPQTGGGGVAISHAEEGVPGWSRACELVKEWQGGIYVTTEFDDSEIAGADYCAVHGVHTNGYPYPDDDFGYRDVTYRGYCEECGTALGQAGPFAIRKPLKWGRNSFVQLHWVVDELFMPAMAWKTRLEPLGVRARSVQDAKNQILNDVIQICSEDRICLDMEGARGRTCATCGRERFAAHLRGYFPAPLGKPDIPIFRSAQYFGAGHMGFNELIVRSDVVAAILSSGLKGVRFWPCAPVNTDAQDRSK